MNRQKESPLLLLKGL